MARSQGVNTGAMILLGMAISNGLVGLAGALFVQTQGGSDISMGIGTIVIGLAAVIVGESILPSRRITVARNQYIQAVQSYNVLARSFPTNLTAKVFSYEPKPSFSVQNEAEISRPPTVDFGNK